MAEGIRTPDPITVTAPCDNTLQDPPTQGGAESGAVGAPQGHSDANLQQVIDAWADLPEAVKTGILAMVASQAK